MFIVVIEFKFVLGIFLAYFRPNFGLFENFSNFFIKLRSIKSVKLVKCKSGVEQTISRAINSTKSDFFTKKLYKFKQFLLKFTKLIYFVILIFCEILEKIAKLNIFENTDL